MESIGDDDGIGEVLSGDGSVSRRQVHANDTNLVFSFQSFEIRFQRQLRPAKNDIVDLVILQIAEGSGIAFASCEEMLIDAEDQRTSRRVPLGELALKSVLEVTLDGGRPDPFSPAQPAAVDAVQVQLVYGLLKSFAGPLTRQDSRKAVAVLPPASLA